ncbi:MAG: hypothetical protein AB8D52_07600 [Gammaproteobacteria bacterium]
MFAPKPAICGNGHAAMLRTYDVDKHLMLNEKKLKQKLARKPRKTKSKT